MNTQIYDFSFMNGDIVDFKYNDKTIESKILGKYIEEGNLWYIITPVDGKFEDYIVIQETDDDFVALRNITFASSDQLIKIEKEK